MADLIRRNVYLRVRPKLGREELRLYRMDDQQARLYDEVCWAMSRRSNMPIGAADQHVLKYVTRLLRGDQSPTGVHRALDQLRQLFPVLTDDDVRALPRKGCPRGRQRAIVLAISMSVGGAPREIRWARYDMTPHQREVFHQTVRQLARVRSTTLDDAHEACVRMVGRLVSGAEIVGDSPHPVAVRLAEAFARMSDERATTLPAASDDDIRELQFTEEQPR